MDQQPLQQQPAQPQQPVAPQVPQPVMPPTTPMTVNQAPFMGAAQKPSKSKKFGIIGGIIGLIIVALAALGVYVSLNAGTSLGELTTMTYHEGEEYEYSLSYFEDAEHENASNTALTPTTTETDIIVNRDEDLLLATSLLTVEDLSSVSDLIGSTITKQELYDVYLESTRGKTTLENIVVLALELDDVDIEGDITEWSNEHFSDGVRADLTGESAEGVQLTGQAIFTVDDDGRFGYTFVIMATDETWEKNADKWPLIEASLKQN